MSLLVTLGVSTAVSVVVFVILFYGFRDKWLRQNRQNIQAEITSLKWIIDDAKADRYRLAEELIEAHREIKNLKNSEVSLKQRIEELEKELLRYQHRDDLPTTPLLLVCGDQFFCDQDASQLNKARVWYRILENATKNDVTEELARRRQNGDLYPWMQITAHGNRDGILLSDGIASPEWWNRQLEGIKVLFAADCDSVEVGDALAGVCDYVVVFYGNRNSDDIADFTYSFWSEMMKTKSVREAYRKALVSTPQLRPFVDLRVR